MRNVIVFLGLMHLERRKVKGYMLLCLFLQLYQTGLNAAPVLVYLLKLAAVTGSTSFCDCLVIFGTLVCNWFIFGT